MNPYELAEIMEVHDGSQVWEHGLEIANMLRQQADRIAELEKQSEPVAWITEKSLKTLSIPLLSIATIQANLKASQIGDFNIPLYTTPQTRQLSDEEIIELFENPDDFSCIEFARAIEAKVRGEK